MKGTGAKRNVCPGSCVSTGAKFPVAPVESAPMIRKLFLLELHKYKTYYTSADLHMAQLVPMPLTVSCFSKIQIGFTFLVPAHPCACVCVCVLFSKKMFLYR